MRGNSSRSQLFSLSNKHYLLKTGIEKKNTVSQTKFFQRTELLKNYSNDPVLIDCKRAELTITHYPKYQASPRAFRTNKKVND